MIGVAADQRRLDARAMRSQLVLLIVIASCASGAAVPAVAQTRGPQATNAVSGVDFDPRADAPPNESVASIGDDLLHNLLHDQKRIWTFPLDLAHGRHAKLVALFAATTAGLVALDSHDGPYFRRTQRFARFNRAFSGLNTGLAEGLFPGALFVAGLLRDDAYGKETALLAGESLIDAEVVSEVAKNATRRLRPSDISPEGDFGHTWFRAQGGILIARGSFPSGHATAAFALASIVAERYKEHHWVPWVAYGLAGAVGFSRVTLQSHFPADVFAGGAIAYVIGHDVVLGRSR